MNVETFRHWLAERGCRFEEGHERRQGAGHPTAVARREGKRVELPQVPAHAELDPEEVRRIVDELGLDWKELPGPQSFQQASGGGPGGRKH